MYKDKINFSLQGCY